MSGRQIYVHQLWDGTGGAISKNGSITSQPIALMDLAGNGVFSLMVKLLTGGAGSVTFTYSLCDTQAGTYITPASAVAIKTALIAGNTGLYSFEPELGKYMKIIATENNVAAITHLTAVVMTQ